MELYGERGYEQTTVAEIAKRAGLTERTFFRHYSDKREVLFDETPDLRMRFAAAVAEAQDTAAPLDAVAAGLDAVSAAFTGRHRHSRQRPAVITANAELRERELIKLASLAAALTDALHRRGVPNPAATLATEAGIAVFKLGFEHWVAEPEERPTADVMRDTLDQLRAVVAPA